MILGMVSGLSMASLALRYDGSVPVNVSVFLGVLVLPQILLLLAYIPVVLLVSIRSSLMATLYAIPAKWGRSLMQFLWVHVVSHLGVKGAERDQVTLGARELTAIFQQHGALFANRVFALVQLAGIAFNLGILLCSVILLMFTDRAFGWQSSLVDAPAKVEQIVRWVSAPWSWALPEQTALPTREQIEGSKIILRESRTQLASENLLAWWPFLILCVIFYGCLPRLFAWLFALWNERRLLASLPFDSVAYDPLIRRMKSLGLQAFGLPSQTRDASSPSFAAHTNGSEVNGVDAPGPQWAVVYLPEESSRRYTDETLKDWLHAQFGGDSKRIEKIPGVECFEPKASSTSAIVPLLLEGWQPPIQETLSQLKTLAVKLNGMDLQLLLILIGKPGKGEGIKPLSENMVQVWHRKIRLLGCRNLIILPAHTEAISA